MRRYVCGGRENEEIKFGTFETFINSQLIVVTYIGACIKS